MRNTPSPAHVRSDASTSLTIRAKGQGASSAQPPSDEEEEEKEEEEEEEEEDGFIRPRLREGGELTAETTTKTVMGSPRAVRSCRVTGSVAETTAAVTLATPLKVSPSSTCTEEKAADTL
jgi:hypothetical protein